jgi:RimJ/RimL family protein N-acetyltransferase
MGGPAPAYTRDLLVLVPQILVVGLLFAVAEELGWRGWLQERAQRLTAPLAAAVFVGLVWGGWHAPLHYLPDTVHAELPVVWFLALVLAAAIAFAALYNASGGSIPVVTVAHVAFNATVGATVLALPAGQDRFVASSAGRRGARCLHRRLRHEGAVVRPVLRADQSRHRRPQGALEMRIPELTTPRLRLRGWTAADVDDWRRICGDPETMRYIGDGSPMPPDRAWHALAHLLGHWALRGYGMWAVAERRSGRLLGRVGLYHPEDWPAVELGWLIDRHHWGQGLAPEAAAAAAAWAFRERHMPSLISLIRPGNTASTRVAEKLGARHERDLELAGEAVALYRLEPEDL